MGTVLVVQTVEEPDQQLLNTARQHVTGTEMDILFCRIIDEKQFQSDLQRKAKSNRDVKTIDEMESIAVTEADKIAAELLGSDIPYTTIGMVGTIPDDLMRLAAEHGCNHIFVSGKQRSPTGKAVFGDVAQSIILQFDGPVTVTTSA